MKKKSHKIIFSYMGNIFHLISFLLLLPIFSLLWFPEELTSIKYFMLPALISLVIGSVLKLLFKKDRQDVINHRVVTTKSQQLVIIFLTWFIACVLFGLPFVFAGILDFSQSFFEASSGLSTTGLSVVDVTAVDNIFLLHRSLIQYFGGIGIILILVTLFSGSVGFELYEAEGHSDRLIPNVKKSAQTILQIYTGFIVMGFIMLMILGMPSFDALNIAICSVATGGFSITPNGIGDYDSMAINYMIMLLMLLGSFSFFTNLLIVTGKFKRVFKISELRLFMLIIAIFTILGTIFSLSSFESNMTVFSTVLFEVISAITGTGFSLILYQDALNINHTFVFLIIIAMIIGGAVGSTSGGVKITRITNVISSIKWDIYNKISTNSKIVARHIYSPIGKVRVGSKEIVSSSNYILLYIFTLLCGTLIFTMYGYPLIESFFEFTSALGNVGISIGITNPDLPGVLLWTLSVGMFIGRLEIYIVIAMFVSIIKKLRQKIR